VKICLATKFYPPDTGGGGIAAYAKYAAMGLLQAGHQVQVISMQSAGSKPFQVVDGIPVYRLPAPLRSYRWTKLPVVGRQVRFLRDWLYSIRIRNLLLRTKSVFKPSIVEYADIDAEGLCNPRELCPYVVKLHTSHVILKNYYSKAEIPYSYRYIEAIEARAIFRAQGVSSPSKYLADEIAQKLTIPRSQIQYVTNLIDTKSYAPSSQKKINELKEILYVGRLEPRKGAVVFAEAIPTILKHRPDVHFTFAGSDRSDKNGISQKKALDEYFTRNGCLDRITFVGHADPEIYKELYQRADIFVMPSLFENSPYTLLEAMSCGCACVVHRSSGLTEMVQDGTSGVLFDNASPQDLAENVIQLLADPELRARLGKNARTRILENYSLKVGTREVVNFYEAVIARSK